MPVGFKMFRVGSAALEAAQHHAKQINKIEIEDGEVELHITHLSSLLPSNVTEL